MRTKSSSPCGNETSVGTPGGLLGCPETGMKYDDWSGPVPVGAKVQVAPPPVKETVAIPVPVAVGPLNEFPPGIEGAEAVDAAPVPAELVAARVQVYGVPLVSPATTSGLEAPVAVTPPGEQVALYPVMAAPPWNAGGVKAIETCWLPAVTDVIAGAPGTTALTVKE